MWHTKTRRKELIKRYHQLGSSTSYEMVLQISTDLGNSVCAQYETNGVVCPPYLTHGIFTTAAVDIIDHNPSSATAGDSFHSTAISVVQHPVGSSRRIAASYLERGIIKTMRPLPQTYVQVMLVSKNSSIEKLKEPMCFDRRKTSGFSVLMIVSPLNV